MKLTFRKMHGLGNDFMVIDTRDQVVSLDTFKIQALGDRRTGVGFDQLVLIETPEDKEKADVFMRIRNRNGSIAETCGNALRCIAKLICEETGKDECSIDTLAGINAAKRDGDIYTINMGAPKFDWQSIPLSDEMDTASLNITDGPLHDPMAVSVGNPHAVFFVEDVNGIDLEDFGPRIETHPYFPEKTNVEIVQVMDEKDLRMRVWERGTGITGACGTGAAASMAAAVKKGLIGRKANVHLDGGVLAFHWNEEDNNIYMSGPATLSYIAEMDCNDC